MVTLLIGFNHSGLNSVIEGQISLFQDSNGSCPDFSVLRLFGILDKGNLNQICDVIRKSVSLLEKKSQTSISPC